MATKRIGIYTGIIALVATLSATAGYCAATHIYNEQAAKMQSSYEWQLDYDKGYINRMKTSYEADIEGLSRALSSERAYYAEADTDRRLNAYANQFIADHVNEIEFIDLSLEGAAPKIVLKDGSVYGPSNDYAYALPQE